MATTKKSTQAKTKTTKKTATRTKTKVAAKAKTAAAKTTRASKTTKAAKPVSATVVKNRKTTAITTKSIRKLHLVKALIAAALAVAAGLLMDSSSYALNIGYQAKDELLSLTAGQTAFVQGSQPLMDVQVRWLVVAILGLSALFSLLAATRLRTRYEANLANSVSPLRWLGMGVTSALIVETVALVSGVSDIFTLKLLAGLMLVTCALGWVTEKRFKQAGRPIWSDFNISIVTGALPWILIGSYAVSTWVYGLIRYPWFVYAVMGAALIGFTLYCANQYKHLAGWRNYLVIERNYVLLALVTQAAFAAILILGFQK